MKKITFKLLVAAALMACFTNGANAQAFTEDFANITTLVPGGWFMQNNSTPVGSTGWSQGATAVFNAQSGAADSYISANYNNTGTTGTISNWLLTPNRTFKNGDVFTFYSRKAAPDSYADRLEVRLSTNGASTDVGTGSAAVGDFTTLLVSINPTLVLGVYPIVWTQYTITISGLPAPTSGRIGFRYFVTGAGLSGVNSDYIGIDNVVYTPYVCPTLTITPTSLTGGTAGVAYSQTLTQTGALGAPSYAVTAGALPAGMSLSLAGVLSGTPTVTGTFNFTVTVADASGCLGSTAYTLVIGCPTFVFTLGSFANGTAGVAYSQTAGTTGGVGGTTYAITAGALPPGLTMSTGGAVTGTPTATGTYNFTITATDANLCTGSAAYSITIVCPTGGATLTVSPGAVCSNAGMITLTGGAPAGGTYSGTGVSGGSFDPTVGSQTITYTLVDAFACTQVATNGITVNAAPTVNANTTASTVCAGTMVTLTGSGTAGVTYAWDNGATDGVAFPATTTTTYNVVGTVTATGCTSTSSVVVNVNANPSVNANTTATAICGGGSVTLTGSGADTYTWDNSVTDGVAFAPSSTTVYTVTGTTTATGCTATATVTVNVNSNPAVGAASNVTGDMVCTGGTVTLTGSGADTYVWDNSVTDGVSFAPTATTVYTVVGTTTSSGCTGTTTITITVNPNPVVDLTFTTSTVCVYATAFTLTGESPAGGTFSGTGVTGSTFDPAAAGAGTYAITYMFTDANGCMGMDTDNMTVDLCTGIASYDSEENVTVYPNPTTGSFTLVYNQNTAGNLSFRITDVQGKVIVSESFSNFSGQYRNVFDLSSVEKGLYMIEVIGSENQAHKKIVLQ